MSGITELLSDLRSRDIRLWTEGESLRFEAPKGALTADLREMLRERKGEILAFLQRAAALSRPESPAIPRLAPGSLAVTSFQQERLWFLAHLLPESLAYNIPAVLRLSGELDRCALAGALGAVIRRHEALRTVFPSDGTRPRLEVVDWKAGDCILPLIDLTSLPAGVRAAESSRLGAAETRRLFDLEQGPLLRATLISLEPGSHLLLLNQHHIVSDRWSTAVLLEELSALYRAACDATAAVLPALLVRYTDYAAWQREMFDGGFQSKQLAYWKAQLAAPLPVLDLPMARTRPAIPLMSGAEHAFRLSDNLSRAAKQLGAREGVTQFILLLAVFTVLLHRYSEQEDLLVGTPVANRGLPETERMIGFFANMLVLRSDLSGNPSFRSLLQRVRRVALGAYENQELPFEKLVEEINPERDLARNPLFQVVFLLNSDAMPELRLPGVRSTLLSAETLSAKFDLMAALQEKPEGLEGLIEYSSDLFPAEAIERMAGHFAALLEGILADPERPIGESPLLTGTESGQILGAWNATAVPFRENVCLHQLFEAQAARSPNAVAARCEGRTMTYGELDHAASRLALRLRARGVRPGSLVGVCLARSLEMVVGLLGVLKAGATYVPIDPAYPEERKTYILESTSAAVLLVCGGQASGLAPALERPEMMEVAPGDAADGVRPDQPETLLPTHFSAKSLAYIIFTSGSTGRPKGVAVQHRQVVNLIEWVNRRFEVGPGDRLLFITSLCFDLSVYDVFGSLAAGAEIYIASESEMADPLLLARTLAGAGITFWDSAPAALQQLVPFFGDMPGDGSALRLVFLSGDWVPLSLPPAVTARFPQARVVALGGATEATIWSNFFAVDAIDPAWRSIPYGMPIQNARYYTLDSHFGLSPIEVPGDLYIGGHCLSIGYFGQPALTAERYLPDPWSGEPGAVLYSTGDRARRLPDGQLEFLGRRDTQVKIRGFRIELGEIEAVLRRHPAVREAVAVVREDRPGDRRLVAYIETQAGGEEDGQIDLRRLEDELAARIRAALPDYMMPGAFVVLDAWPVTANGKLDRKSLPSPQTAANSEEHVLPATPLERALALVWSEILGVERVGARDNFFRLGGHSLLAIQVVSALRSKLGIEIPLRELFASPTPAELAEHIATMVDNGDAEPPLLKVPRQGDLPLSFAQERLWFIDRLQPDSAAYNISGAMRLDGDLDRAALEWSLRRIVDRHEPLRSTFPEKEGQPSLSIHGHLELAVPRVDLASLPAARRRAETRRLAETDAQRPFNLERAPLLRTTLLALAPKEHVLLLTTHHIVSDAWSVGVTLRELITFYIARCRGEAPALPELPVDYVDYVVWQRRRLSGAVLDRQLGYWRQQLDKAPPVLQLPTDRPRPATFRFRGGMETFAVPASTLAGIEELRGVEHVTRFMLLLAAFQALLARYTGQSDILIGSPVANRDRSELEGLIGFFVNTLVFRANLADDPSFRTLLARTRVTALAAFDHQELPFDKLVEEINPGRDLSRNPLFQVVLTVQNSPVPDQHMQGLSASVLPLENQTAKFDLTLDLTEDAGALRGRLEYDSDIFLASTMQRLAGHFTTLLAGIVDDPERRLIELPLLSASESWQVTAEWNDTAAARPHRSVLHELFERQAAAAPGRLAAVCGEARVTYGELEERANRLAHFLIARGAAPGELIGIFLERSLDMLVGLLGILKTGAAYIPIDLSYPKDRIRHILGETGARFVLTRGPLFESLADTCRGAGVRARLLRLDREDFSSFPAAAPHRRAADDDLAYIIFTSGSTGRPKGVVVQHRPVVNLIEWVNGAFRVGPADRLLFVTSLCFDLSVYDIFGILAAGGVVHVATQAELDDPPALVEALTRGGITFWDSAPAALQRLVSLLPAAGTGGQDLRLAFLSGDWIPLSLPPAVTAVFPALKVISLGGATEATIWSNVFPVTEVHPDWRSIPYGRPIRHARYLVLDWALQPCPVGVPGALYIGGEVLSLGYFNRPGLTAERYTPDPYGAPGATLYSTGDRARWLSDGNLEFLGRMDSQVKIRGFRIEPGEIEAVLREHPEFREAVVMPIEDRRGDRQLAAWVEPLPGSSLAGLDPEAFARSVRSYLRERLPEYLIPALFASVAGWPVTANGKLDRKALTQTGLAAGTAGPSAQVAARTPVEELLVGIWSELLAVPNIGVHDDFFALGGHSILVTQLASRLRQIFGVEIPLRRFFDSSTISDLAGLLTEAASEKTSGAPLPPLTPLPDRSRAPLSYAQEQLWIEHRLNPGSAAYNVPFSFHMHGALHLPAFARVVNELAARHGALRTTFPLLEGRPVQVVHLLHSVPLPVADLCALPDGVQEAEARRLADEEALTPFDLERGPLFRVRIFRLAPEHHLAVFDIHHIAFDGWSIGVFLREMAALYQAFRFGQPSPLPPLALQYADFAFWQRSWLDGEALSTSLESWRRYLAGAPPTLELPSRRPRPAVMTSRGGAVTLALTREQTGALKTLSRRHGCTLFMTLVAAFNVLLYHHTRAEDLVIGTDVAGRGNPELDRLVGFFVNQVAMRMSLAGDPAFGDIVARVRQSLLDAYSHQETPFSKVVEALNPPRDRSRPPIFQIKIGLQAPAARSIELPGLTLREYPIGGQTAKHDIWLNLWEEEERLVGRMEHNRDTVRREVAVRFLRQYELLLAELTANAELTLSALDDHIAKLTVPAASEGLTAARASLFARKLGRKEAGSGPGLQQPNESR